jgi:hypothetical protein
MYKVLIVFLSCVTGSACFAQAAGTGGNAVIALLPFLAIIPLVWFFVVKPVRKNMSENNLGFLASIPAAVFIVAGVLMLGGALFSMIVVDDMIAKSMVYRISRDEISLVRYSGYGIGVLGAILLLVGLLKGIQK